MIRKMNKYERALSNTYFRRIKFTMDCFKKISHSCKELKIRMFLFMNNSMLSVNDRNLNIVMLKFYNNQKNINDDKNNKNKQKLSINVF